MLLPFFEIKLYIGNREGYHGPIYPQKQLYKLLRDFQKKIDKTIDLKITRCTFMKGEWDEEGWEISSLNLTQAPNKILKEWFHLLADFLAVNLKQQQVIVCDLDYIKVHQ